MNKFTHVQKEPFHLHPTHCHDFTKTLFSRQALEKSKKTLAARFTGPPGYFFDCFMIYQKG